MPRFSCGHSQSRRGTYSAVLCDNCSRANVRRHFTECFRDVSAQCYCGKPKEVKEIPMTLEEKYEKLKKYVEFIAECGDSGDHRDGATEVLKEVE